MKLVELTNGLGAVRMELVLVPDLIAIEEVGPSADAIDIHADALCAPIAFQLAVALVQSQPWPRFKVTCRAPSCRRVFYSGRKNAVTCQRTSSRGDRSACKAEWDAYRKWLQKQHRDPENCWADAGLTAGFLKQYRPRGHLPKWA